MGIDLRMVLQVVQLGQTGGHGHRVAAEGTRLVHRAAGGHLLHEGTAAAVGAHRHTAADDLAEGHQVGLHAEILLSTAQSQPEAGDNLVKDQEGSALVAQGPQPLQEAGSRIDHAHVGGHRLHDDAGDLAGVSVQQGLHGGQVVELGGKGVLHDVLGHTGGGGMAARQGGGTGVHQQAVGVAVVAALKLDDLVPAGGPPGQTDGGHHRLGARVDHAHHLDVGHQVDHQLGDLHLPAGGSAEGQAVLDGLLHRLPDHRVVMAQDHGTPGAHIVNILPAVLVPDEGAVGPGDEAGGHAHRPVGPHRGVDSAGQDLHGLLKQFFRASHQPMSPF